MTGGSSGGPWFEALTEHQRDQRHAQLAELCTVTPGIRNMYGPKFNGDTQATYSAATDANPDRHSSVAGAP